MKEIREKKYSQKIQKKTFFRIQYLQYYSSCSSLFQLSLHLYQRMIPLTRPWRSIAAVEQMFSSTAAIAVAFRLWCTLAQIPLKLQDGETQITHCQSMTRFLKRTKAYQSITRFQRVPRRTSLWPVSKEYQGVLVHDSFPRSTKAY